MGCTAGPIPDRREVGGLVAVAKRSPFAKGHRANFRSLCESANEDELCMIECQEKDTGKPVVIVCAVNTLPDRSIEYVPLARMFDGNPYDEILPPTMDAPKSIQ